jgi:hypothetical protein
MAYNFARRLKTLKETLNNSVLPKIRRGLLLKILKSFDFASDLAAFR